MPSRLFALCLASIVLIGPLSMHLFLPAIPAVKAEFGLSEAIAQLTFTGGILAMAFSTLVYGTLADRYGRRPVLLGGLALFLVGTAIVSVANSLAMLLVGRIVQAVGAGCGTTLVRTIARDAYGQAQLAKAIAYLTMFYTMGPMIAPLMGGILIDAYGWREAFMFALALGSVVAFGAWAVVYETHRPSRTRFDAVAVLRSYVDPFRDARFAAFVLQTGFSSGVFFTLAAGASVIMKEQLGRPSTEYGLYFLAFPVGFLLGTLLSSRLVGRIAGETLVIVGSAMVFVTIVAQAALLLAGYVNPLVLFAPGFLLTFSQGITLPSAQAGAMALVPSSVGTAAGIGVFTQFFFGAVIAQIYGMVAGQSVVPLVVVLVLSSTVVLVLGSVPFRLARRGQT
jgi:DHA1 family bicyclomycin/chloramphenicol resistance-like MFS transporter